MEVLVEELDLLLEAAVGLQLQLGAGKVLAGVEDVLQNIIQVFCLNFNITLFLNLDGVVAGELPHSLDEILDAL